MNTNMFNPRLKEEVSAYWSDDRTKKAVIINNYGILEIHFFKNGELEAIESYDNHSIFYHEDAAENYVLGVKNFT